jgi:hypothetical protein
VHCQDVHGVSQRGPWPVYALISSLNDICETRGREILSRGIATLDVAMLFGISWQPKLSYKHRNAHYGLPGAIKSRPYM